MHDRSIAGPALLIIVAAIGFAGSMALGAQAQDATSPGSPPVPECAGEGSFLTETAAAMDSMMAGMAVKPTGDADADFAATMIPHHQGAIAMALAELRYGKNEQLRRIAQEIIIEQQQEIAAMRLALGQSPPPSAPAPTQVSRADAAPAPVRPGHDHSAIPDGTMPIPPCR